VRAHRRASPSIGLRAHCTHVALETCSLTVSPQAYELSVLTGTQVLLLVVSETGLVYTFTTPKLQPLVTKPEGKNLIQVRCTPLYTLSRHITDAC
jgi:hypothetical protein